MSEELKQRLMQDPNGLRVVYGQYINGVATNPSEMAQALIDRLAESQLQRAIDAMGISTKGLTWGTKASEWEGKPCEQGINAAQTGCIPASGEGGKKPSAGEEAKTPEDQPDPDLEQRLKLRDQAKATTSKRIGKQLEEIGAKDKMLGRAELVDMIERITYDLELDKETLEHLKGACNDETCPKTGERYTVSLYEGKNLSVYLLRWGEGQQADWHDHGDGADGARVGIRVLEGPVENDFINSKGNIIRQRLEVGDTYWLPAPYIHRVATGEGKPTWSVHAYAGPKGGLNHMNFYKFDPKTNLPEIKDGKPVKVSDWKLEDTPVAPISEKYLGKYGNKAMSEKDKGDMDPDGGVHHRVNGKWVPVPFISKDGKEEQKKKPSVRDKYRKRKKG